MSVQCKDIRISKETTGGIYDPTEVMTDIAEVMTDAAGTIAERTEVMT